MAFEEFYEEAVLGPKASFFVNRKEEREAKRKTRKRKAEIE